MAVSMDALSNQLLNQISNQGNTGATSKMENELKNKDYSKATEDELMEACKEFEAYFMEQMFKNMEKMVPKSEFESGYAQALTDYFKEEQVKEYTAQAIKSGQGIGLAKQLYEQMKRNYDIQ